MDTLTKISLIISVISIFGLIYQSIILKATIDNQIYQSFVSNSVKIDEMLITYPELRKYVYDNEPIDESTPDLDRVMSMVELIVDCMENIEVYKKYLPRNRKSGWLQYVIDIKNTPAYEFFTKKNGGWFEVE